MQTGKVVTTASSTGGGKFTVKIEKRSIGLVEYVEADYLLIASGSSRQVGMVHRLICNVFLHRVYYSLNIIVVITGI